MDPRQRCAIGMRSGKCTRAVAWIFSPTLCFTTTFLLLPKLLISFLRRMTLDHSPIYPFRRYLVIQAKNPYRWGPLFISRCHECQGSPASSMILRFVLHAWNTFKSAADKSFSRDRNWRRALRARIMSLSGLAPGRFEDLEECRRKIFEDLLDSRTQIETKLSNKLVRHLCYPWYTGSPIAIKASSDAGFVTNFWGTLPPSIHANALPGILNISRIPGEYLLTLPGKGRNSLGSIITRQIAERVRQSCRS